MPETLASPLHPHVSVGLARPGGLRVFLVASTVRAPCGQSGDNQRCMCFKDYRRWGHTNTESWGLAFEKFNIQKSGAGGTCPHTQV